MALGFGWVVGKIGEVSTDLVLNPFHSGASAESVPEVDLVEEASEGWAFHNGGFVGDEFGCCEVFPVL